MQKKFGRWQKVVPSKYLNIFATLPTKIKG
jgi:hypothetical protein